MIKILLLLGTALMGCMALAETANNMRRCESPLRRSSAYAERNRANRQVRETDHYDLQDSYGARFDEQSDRGATDMDGRDGGEHY